MRIERRDTAWVKRKRFVYERWRYATKHTTSVIKIFIVWSYNRHNFCIVLSLFWHFFCFPFFFLPEAINWVLGHPISACFCLLLIFMEQYLYGSRYVEQVYYNFNAFRQWIIIAGTCGEKGSQRTWSSSTEWQRSHNSLKFYALRDIERDSDLDLMVSVAIANTSVRGKQEEIVLRSASSTSSSSRICYSHRLTCAQTHIFSSTLAALRILIETFLLAVRFACCCTKVGHNSRSVSFSFYQKNVCCRRRGTFNATFQMLYNYSWRWFDDMRSWI